VGLWEKISLRIKEAIDDVHSDVREDVATLREQVAQLRDDLVRTRAELTDRSKQQRPTPTPPTSGSVTKAPPVKSSGPAPKK
jgi:hypothetical protein